jgi:hypothetical protein
MSEVELLREFMKEFWGGIFLMGILPAFLISIVAYVCEHRHGLGAKRGE